MAKDSSGTNPAQDDAKAPAGWTWEHAARLLRRFQLEEAEGKRPSWRDTLPEGDVPVTIPHGSAPTDTAAPIGTGTLTVIVGSALYQGIFSTGARFADNALNLVESQLVRHQVPREARDGNIATVSVEGPVAYNVAVNRTSLTITKSMLNEDGEYDNLTLVGVFDLERETTALVLTLDDSAIALRRDAVTYHGTRMHMGVGPHELGVLFDSHMLIVDMKTDTVQSYERLDDLVGPAGPAAGGAPAAQAAPAGAADGTAHDASYVFTDNERYSVLDALARAYAHEPLARKAILAGHWDDRTLTVGGLEELDGVLSLANVKDYDDWRERANW